MTQILDHLDAKKKFVESLTKNKCFDGDDFLKPVQTRGVIESDLSQVVEESDLSQVVEESDLSKEIKKSVREDDYISKKEFKRSLRRLELKSGLELGNVPEWAKLAMASSNPNTKQKFYY